MSITLSDGTTTVELNEDLQWSDEWQWAAVSQSVTPSITGAQIVQLGTYQAGRPITLAPESEASGWVTRATLDTLRSWVDTAGQQMTLTLRGVAHTVMWRHQDAAGAITAAPVVAYSDVDAADYYRATLRFFKV